jgi:regulator of sigma E protease
MQSIVSLFTTYLPYFFLVLTLLVFIHEYGHYWVGRRFGIHAEVFSIGFGPEIFGWTDRNGTRWKVSAIPLGGYVKFLGDNDATSATPADVPLSASDRKRAFFSQPLHARAAVVLGGPAANLLFAFLLLTGVFFFAGEPYTPATVAVQVDGPAAKAGLRTGDEIVRLADKRVDRYEDIQESQFLYWTHPMSVEYRRGNQLLRGEIAAAVLRAHRSLQQHAALRRSRYRSAHSPGRRWLHGQQPGRGGGPQGRRSAAGDRRQARRILLPDSRTDRLPRRSTGDRHLRARTAVLREDAPVVPIADKTLDCAGKEQVDRSPARTPCRRSPSYRDQGVIGAMGAGVNRAVWGMTTMFYTSMGQILTAARPVDELGRTYPHRQGRRRGVACRMGGHPQSRHRACPSCSAVFNLLPVPMLDGGHLAMYALRGGARPAAQPAELRRLG